MTAPTPEPTLEVTTERVRGAATGEQNVPVTPEQFDRWLAAHDAQVRAEALRAVVADGKWAVRANMGGYPVTAVPVSTLVDLSAMAGHGWWPNETPKEAPHA